MSEGEERMNHFPPITEEKAAADGFATSSSGIVDHNPGQDSFSAPLGTVNDSPRTLHSINDEAEVPEVPDVFSSPLVLGPSAGLRIQTGSPEELGSAKRPPTGAAVGTDKHVQSGPKERPEALKYTKSNPEMNKKIRHLRHTSHVKRSFVRKGTVAELLQKEQEKAALSGSQSMESSAVAPQPTAEDQEEIKCFLYAKTLRESWPKKDDRYSKDLKGLIQYFMRVNSRKRLLQCMFEDFLGLPSVCKTCKSLDLTMEKFLVRDRGQTLKEIRLFHSVHRQNRRGGGLFEIGSGSQSRKLGTLKSIWNKSSACPLCRLVLLSLKEQSVADWISVEDVPGNEIADRSVEEEEKIPDKVKREAHEAKLKLLAQKRSELEAVCYASWQIDGRELIENGNHEIESHSRTRRIRLHWEFKDESLKEYFRESYLVLVGGPTLPAVDLFLGRRVETGPANLELMHNWINACHGHHGDRCQIQTNPRFRFMVRQAFFGVIDVRDMRLCELPAGSRYVALSYIWGAIKPFTTTLANVRKLQEKGGIEKVLREIPRTIRDSIKLVRDLGEQYLWVDSICIVQDSQKSWELNAGYMDQVYGNAYFTICAADGQDANAGLKAMNPTERDFSQHMEYYALGVRLMASYLVEAHIQSSAWDQRAWTFQERLLSKRCLVFVDSRVFFQCRATTLREDINAEEKTGWTIDHAKAPLQMLDHLDSRAILLYKNAVKIYTRRNLTRPENILSAFEGIGKMVEEKLGAGLIFGLPRSHFDWALLWEPRGAARPRVVPDKNETDLQTFIKLVKELSGGNLNRLLQMIINKSDDEIQSFTKHRILDAASKLLKAEEAEARMHHARPESQDTSGLAKKSNDSPDLKESPGETSVNVQNGTARPASFSGSATGNPMAYKTSQVTSVDGVDSKSMAHRVKPKSSGFKQSTRKFPSWSWSGWTGAVMDYKPSILQGTMENVHDWLKNHTWIIWYLRDGHGNLTPVWDGLKSSECYTEDRWKGYEKPTPQTDPYGRTPKGVPATREPFQKTIPEYPYGVNISDPCEEPERHFPDQQYLQFSTWSAYLRLTEHHRPTPPFAATADSGGGTTRPTSSSGGVQPDGLKRYGITDYKGDWCGTIVLDGGLPERKFAPDTEHLFIAISEARGFDRDEHDGWMYYISKEKELSEWDLYYVLLIEIEDEIAYRVGLGKVYKEAFNNSCREEKQWKEFILG